MYKRQDVAFGVMHYYFASGDEKFLFDKGAEILLETSRFWSERVDKGCLLYTSTTSTGRLIFPCYQYTSGVQRTSTIYSDDDGTTWHRGEMCIRDRYRV